MAENPNLYERAIEIFNNHIEPDIARENSSRGTKIINFSVIDGSVISADESIENICNMVHSGEHVIGCVVSENNSSRYYFILPNVNTFTTTADGQVVRAVANFVGVTTNIEDDNYFGIVKCVGVYDVGAEETWSFSMYEGNHQ